MSVAGDGTQGNGDSTDSSTSADGAVAFLSAASNLVPGDHNGAIDIFVRDSGTTERVSVPSVGLGEESNGDSHGPSITPDGRFVAFRSNASNLVPGDTNGNTDDFVYDRRTGVTERVSVASDGTQANGEGLEPSISADGRSVAFRSFASNLVPGDTNGVSDIFVRDRQTGTTTRVSVTSDGTQANGDNFGPFFSADGSAVAFRSYASNLVLGDTNASADVMIRDLRAGTTTQVSVASSGTQGNGDSYGPSVSADGNLVAFRSTSSNLVGGDSNGADDIFVRDRRTGTTTRVSVASDGTQGNGHSYGPSISSTTGRFVVLRSAASNLISGDMNGKDDIFVHDRQIGSTERVSVASDGTQSDGHSYNPTISAGGRFVGFSSGAKNLVSGDTNRASDVFRRDLGVPSSAPPAPTFTATDPPSPANHNTPRIQGSAPAGSTVKLYTTSDCSGTPPVTGTATDFASPGLAVSVPDDSSTTFRATATATADGATSDCSASSITYVEDSTPPSGGQITSVLPDFGLTIPITVSWGGASDPGSGVASYRAYVRSAPYDGGFASPSQFATTSAPGSASFAGGVGHTHCFSVTVTDKAGNSSSSSAETCSALPVDDPGLAGSGWTRSANQPGYYQGTSATSSTKGATLSLAGVQAKGIALVVTTCPTCGKVQVLQGGSALKTVNLASKSGQTEQMITVASFANVRTGTVTLRVTTAGKPVIIDGLGVSRN